MSKHVVIITPFVGVSVAARELLLVDIRKGNESSIVDFSGDPMLPYYEGDACVVVQPRWLKSPRWFSPPFVMILTFLVLVGVPHVAVLMFGRRS